MLAEIFASQVGLGNVINFYFNNLLIEEMYATLLLIFVAAFVLNIGLLHIQKYLEANEYGGADKGSAMGF